MGQTAEQLRSIARSYIVLLAAFDERDRRDVDALVAMMAPDVVYEIPFLDRPLTLNGRAAVHAFISATQGMFTDVSYDIDRTIVDADQQVVAIELRSARYILPERERYGNRYVLVFTIADGLIADFREYVNPLPAAKLAARLKLDRRDGPPLELMKRRSE